MVYIGPFLLPCNYFLHDRERMGGIKGILDIENNNDSLPGDKGGYILTTKGMTVEVVFNAHMCLVIRMFTHNVNG